MDELKQLTQDCLETIELLSGCLFAGEDISDDDVLNITSRLHDRFRAIAPDWHGVLPLETPERNETTEEVIERLKHS